MTPEIRSALQFAPSGLNLPSDGKAAMAALLQRRREPSIQAYFAHFPQFLALANRLDGKEPLPPPPKVTADPIVGRWLEMSPRSPGYSGSGIVTCGGGSYAPSVWVLVNLLRRLGCTLPIECFCLGDEYEVRWVLALATLGVRVINAEEIGFRGHPFAPKVSFGDHHYSTQILQGFAIKSFAILNSSFERALFLDADNCPARDPSFLLGTPLDATGCILWPDVADSHLRPNWAGFGVPDASERPVATESGQIAVDKSRCHRELWIANQFNSYAEEFYRHGWGDKDAYPAAFALCGTVVTRPANFPARDWPAIVQHDLEGSPLFWHRAGPAGKWQMSGVNAAPFSYPHHAWCLEALSTYENALHGAGMHAGVTTREVEVRSLAGHAATPPMMVDDNTALARVMWRPVLFTDRRDKNIGRWFIETGYWESWITAFLLEQVRGGMRCVDVGAHAGYYTALFAEAVGPSGKVLAVEPQAHQAALLRRSIRGNRWSGVTIRECAVGEKAGEIDIYWSYQNPAASTIAAIAPPVDRQTRRVPVVTLDDLTADWDLDRVDVVKIDAEGAEHAIWRGMKRLRATKTAFLLEVRTSRLENPAGLLAEIEAEYPLLEVFTDAKLHKVTPADVLRDKDRDFMLWLKKP